MLLLSLIGSVIAPLLSLCFQNKYILDKNLYQSNAARVLIIGPPECEKSYFLSHFFSTLTMVSEKCLSTHFLYIKKFIKKIIKCSNNFIPAKITQGILSEDALDLLFVEKL